jgi:hypothetical protein
VGTAAAGGSASSVLDIHDTAAVNVSATAYASGGSGGSNEGGSVGGAAGAVTASTTLIGAGGAYGVSTAIGAGGGSVADGSSVGGGGVTATTDVTGPGQYDLLQRVGHSQRGRRFQRLRPHRR